MKGSLIKIWFVFIFIIAIVLRFYGIKERGLFQSDEGYYLQAARTIRAGLDWIVGKMGRKEQPPLEDVLLEKGGTIPSAAKPGFLSLIVFFSLFMGMQDSTGVFVSSILGTLTIFLIFLIGKRLWNVKAGLIAATILAVLNYHIGSSRSGLAESSSAFFASCGVLFYLYSLKPPNNKHLFISGLSIGYAFTCHYNLFLIPLIFLCFELIRKDFKAKRLIILSISMAIPLLVFEAIYMLVKIFIYSKGFGHILEKTVWGKFYTYFGQIIHQVSMGGKVGISNPFFYIKLIIRNDGYFLFFLLVLGIISVILKRKELQRENYLILFLFFLPVFFWSFISSLQYDRCFFITSYTFPLICAFGLVKFVKKGWVMSFIILFIFVNGILHSIPTIKAKSGYLNAIEYMKKHKGIKHFGSIPTISRFYVGIKNVHNLQKKSYAEIKRLYNEGFNYLLLDQDKYAYGDNIFVNRAKLVKPVFETPHSTTIFIYEGFNPYTRKKILLEPRVLRVYDMRDILNLPSSIPSRNINIQN